MRTADPQRIGRYALVALGFAAVFGTHLALTTYYLDRTNMGADEGFYALAARNALDGELPYRDFAYTQMPLLPYWNGLALEIGGYGLVEQRVVNIVWSCLGLLGIILALRQRLGRWEPGIVAAFAVAASPHWAELQAAGTSNGVAGMFLALSTGVVLTSYPIKWRAIGFGLLGTLAVGSRLSCGPVVLLLEAALVLEASGRRERLIALAVPAAFAVVGLVPFFAAAPEAMLYNVWHYHLASVLDRRGLFQIIEWWRVSPAAILLAVIGLFGLPSLIRKRQWSVVLLLAAAVLGIALPMIPRSAYGSYVAPAMLVAATAGITTLWTTGHVRQSPFRHAIWLLPLLVLYHPLPETVPSTSGPILEIADYVRAKVPPGPLLTPLPIVAVEADREVIPGTELGMFSVMHPRQDELARRLKLTTLIDLIDVLDAKEPAAVVKLSGASTWNFKWTAPSLRRQPRKRYAEFERALRQNYRRVERVERLEVLVPR
jgi:hypothetical protein